MAPIAPAGSGRRHLKPIFREPTNPDCACDLCRKEKGLEPRPLGKPGPKPRQRLLSKPKVGQRLLGFTVDEVHPGAGPRLYEVVLRGGRRLTVEVGRPRTDPLPLVRDDL